MKRSIQEIPIGMDVEKVQDLLLRAAELLRWCQRHVPESGEKEIDQWLKDAGYFYKEDK